MAYVDVDGVRLYWESGGTGEPLLLIQGLGFSCDMWYRITPRLEERYHVIRYDARGIGRSDVPDGPYTIELAASDAIAVLDAAGVDRAHILGVSLGGIVAQEVVLSYPERALSLLLGCTHPGGDGTTWPDTEVMTMLTSRASLPPEESIRASIPYAYAPDTPAEVIDEDVRRRLAIRATERGYTNQLTGGLGYQGTRHRLSQIQVPTLVFTGDLDRLVPPVNSELLANEIPGAKLVTMAGAAHVFFTDRPEVCCDVILGFLDDVKARA